MLVEGVTRTSASASASRSGSCRGVPSPRATGASPWRIIRTVILPEALGPLVLGFTFAVIAIVDMSAVAGLGALLVVVALIGYGLFRRGEAFLDDVSSAFDPGPAPTAVLTVALSPMMVEPSAKRNW